ncbi:J domain-containing protein [Streptomyces sp. PKU-EA00015]|uniref:J domain-containing protein n=1 Tax=Streptomyces sp. PKU-EA00015 TaxID=2748326 RepID=UPI00159FB8CF|nr:J domain-containing protein [Streptomyces sp. PKU-EA00015]NWF30956.1 J domain-containing protein [Streptomyces sp. PKU-EA00015]
MPTQGPESHYAVLGVSPRASAEQITTAFRSLVRTLHPDARPDDPPGSRDQLDLVLAAYDVLRDPQRRAAYDAERTATAPHPVREGPLRVGSEEPAACAYQMVVVIGPWPRSPLRGATVRAGPVRVQPLSG